MHWLVLMDSNDNDDDRLGFFQLQMCSCYSATLLLSYSINLEPQPRRHHTQLRSGRRQKREENEISLVAKLTRA